jgi:hypothetical protein
MVSVSSATERPSRSIAVTTTVSRESVREDLIRFNASPCERGELSTEVLAHGAHTGVPENLRHITTVSLSSDIEDLRHAV